MVVVQRLTWLENIFSSPVLGPVKFANRRFGLGTLNLVLDFQPGVLVDLHMGECWESQARGSGATNTTMASSWEKVDNPNGRSVALLVSSVPRVERPAVLVFLQGSLDP